MEWFSAAYHYPLAIILFATSIVLVIGSPGRRGIRLRVFAGRGKKALLLENSDRAFGAVRNTGHASRG
jgi:hypothetical protein